MGVLII